MNGMLLCYIGGLMVLIGFMSGCDEKKCNVSPIDCGNVWCCLKHYGTPLLMIIGAIVFIYGLGIHFKLI
jgi:hypothetical protein